MAGFVPIPGATSYGDINLDGQRNTGDALVLLSQFTCTQACGADIDGDGKVMTADLLIFLTVYGVPCAE